MRLSLAATLAIALLGLAPAAPAQTLVSTVGDPIPYRIDLPGDWKITRLSRDAPNATIHALVAADGANGSVAISAADLAARADRPADVEARMRRWMTESILGSDSLMYAIMESSIASNGWKVQDAVREIRTLAGQRAAYMRGRFEARGMPVSFEMLLTVRDGIYYSIVSIVGMPDDYAAHAPLFARIRESFVLAPAPK
jgi:hypothetical protein